MLREFNWSWREVLFESFLKWYYVGAELDAVRENCSKFFKWKGPICEGDRHDSNKSYRLFHVGMLFFYF